jgi:PAS domain S-box-containing protein
MEDAKVKACKGCHQQIYIGARRCPYCRQRQNKMSKFFVVLALTLVILMTMSWFSYQYSVHAREANNLEDRTFVVINEFGDLLSSLKDAETGQRGFIITGDREYLEPYNESLSLLDRHLSTLRNLTSDNPSQQRLLSTIEPLIRARLSTLDEIIKLRSTKGLQSASDRIKMGMGKNTMNSLRELVGQALGEEKELLRVRSTLEKKYANRVVYSLLFGGILSSIILVTLYAALWREYAKRLIIEGELSVHRDQLEEQTVELTQSLNNLEVEVAERQKSEERLRLLIDGAKDYAIIMLDVAGCVISWNEGAKRLKGWDAEEILGRHLSLFHTEKEVAAGHPERELEIAVTEGRYAEESWRVRKDGSKFMADVVITAIRDDSGKLLGFSKITRDITERKRAEEELRMSKEAAEVATQAKSQFLANMSHELRTPMTGVLGMLDLVLAGNLEAEQREFISIAHTSALSLVRILNDILDLTKIEMGKISIEAKPFSIRKCVEDTLNILLPVAKIKGLDLDFTVADDVPVTLVGDQTRINQILTNLAGNAVKFTEKGRVELRVAASGGAPGGKQEITFTVTDTGIGIHYDKRDLLFRVFSQVDESHSRGYGGTGLGLVISKELVERMGGTINFTSEEGKGSTFFCTIPLGEAESKRDVILTTEKTATPGDAHRAEKLTKPRLLVAEDDQVIRQILGKMLRISGYETEFAENGQLVVEMWENGNYDLIMMDIQMPRMNGFEATVAIREKERTCGGHIPIIAMTAHASKEYEEQCLVVGMDAYISKPIDFKECLQLILETFKNTSKFRVWTRAT